MGPFLAIQRFFVATLLLLWTTVSLAENNHFEILASSQWKLQKSAFDGQIYRKAGSTNDEFIVTYVRPRVGSLDYEKTKHLLDRISSARSEVLSLFETSDFNILSVELREFSHARNMRVLVFESSYVSASGRETRQVERHYYAAHAIYSVVYSRVSASFGERRQLDDLMNQFVPRIQGSRRPAASETVQSTAKSLGTSRQVRSSAEGSMKVSAQTQAAGICDDVESSIRKSASDPQTFSLEGLKSAGGGCWQGVKDSIPSLYEGLLKTGEYIGKAWKYLKETDQGTFATQVYSGATVAIEAIRNGDKLAQKAWLNIIEVMSTGTRKFACMRLDLQMKAFCKFVALSAEGAVLGAFAWKGAKVGGELIVKGAKFANSAVEEVISEAATKGKKAVAAEPALLEKPIVQKLKTESPEPSATSPKKVDAAKAPDEVTAVQSQPKTTSGPFASVEDEILQAVADKTFAKNLLKDHDELRVYAELYKKSQGQSGPLIEKAIKAGVARAEMRSIFSRAVAEKLSVDEVDALMRKSPGMEKVIILEGVRNEKFAIETFKSLDEIKLYAELDKATKGDSTFRVLQMVNRFKVPRSEVESIFTDAAVRKLSLDELEKNLAAKALPLERKTFEAEIGKVGTDRELIIAVNYFGDQPKGRVQKLLGKAGNEAVEDILLLSKNGRLDEVFEAANRLEREGIKALPAIRGELAKSRGVISREAHRQALDFTTPTLDDIKKVRAAERAGSDGIKTFRHADEDVFKVLKDYPMLAKNFDEQAAKLKKAKVLAKISSPDKIPKMKKEMRERIAAADPRVQDSVVGIWNRMNDREYLAVYARTLAEDAAVEMMKSGTKREIDALSRGEITRTAVLKVLVQRHRAQGNDQFSTLVGMPRPDLPGFKPSSKTRKNSDDKSFRSAVKQGPFFDRLFADKRHGVDIHFLQIDYASDVIWQATKKEPRVFWDFLGSAKGIHYWVDLFDSRVDDTFARPEHLAHNVSKLLKITD